MTRSCYFGDNRVQSNQVITGKKLGGLGGTKYIAKLNFFFLFPRYNKNPVITKFFWGFATFVIAGFDCSILTDN